VSIQIKLAAKELKERKDRNDLKGAQGAYSLCAFCALWRHGSGLREHAQAPA